jgi:hypothetical protein
VNKFCVEDITEGGPADESGSIAVGDVLVCTE